MTHPLDSLLREALSARRPGDEAARCLDEQRLAAWFEGTLTADDRRTVEAHAADCARCQMLLAEMARITPAAAPRAWWRGSAMKWIVPLATAAASAVLWLNLSDRSSSQRAAAPLVATKIEPREADAAASRAREAQDPASAQREAQDNVQLQARASTKAADDVAAERELRRQEPAALSERRQEAAALGERRREPEALSKSKDERQAARDAVIPLPQVNPLRDGSALPGAAEVPPVARPEAPKVDSLGSAAQARDTDTFRSPAPAAPAPAAAAGAPTSVPPPAVSRRADAAAQGQMAETVMTADMLRNGLVPESARQIVIPSADSRTIWRIRGLSYVQRSTDGGVQWQTQTNGGNANFNAGSSPSSNVCWIVGSGGIVMLSSDGRTWRRLPFPETVELVAVTATDERSAVVMSVDGRRFTTVDGGRNWKP